MHDSTPLIPATLYALEWLEQRDYATRRTKGATKGFHSPVAVA